MNSAIIREEIGTMKLYGTVNTEVDVSKYNILIAAAQILYDGHL